MKWFLKCLKQYADFKGRARRREYWMFFLFLTLIQLAIYVVIWLTHQGANPQEMVRLTRIPQLCVALAFLLPNLAALTRRLHDVGESGWFLLPVLVLSWGTLFLPELINENMYFILLYPVAGVFALLFLIKLVKAGQPGMNKYGPNPKELDAPDDLKHGMSKTGNGTNKGKGYYERDNRGTRIETRDTANSYWTARMMAQHKDPFVMYRFGNESDVRAAMLDLPFIHEAKDTGKIICDEIFSFGYYNIREDKIPAISYEAFVAGRGLTHKMWEELHSSFARHNGKKFNDLEPGETTTTTPAQTGNKANIKFIRENQNGAKTYRIHKAPCKADAVAFLSAQDISRPLYYLVVETPEGNFCKDNQGFYQE